MHCLCDPYLGHLLYMQLLHTHWDVTYTLYLSHTIVHITATIYFIIGLLAPKMEYAGSTYTDSVEVICTQLP